MTILSNITTGFFYDSHGVVETGGNRWNKSGAKLLTTEPGHWVHETLP